MAKNTAREKIKLEHAETGEFYTTTKNKRNTPEKLELMKYSRKLKKHVLFKERKIK